MVEVTGDNVAQIAAKLAAGELPPSIKLTADAIRQAFLVPFPDDEVKVKPAKVSNNRALALHYIDARCVMDRLDSVVGVDGWADAYTVLPTGEVECRLSVRIAGQWITKADVGGQSDQPDEGDRLKAAYSDALKRAAVKFGIGRFLYRIPQQWMDYDPVKKQIVRPKPRPFAAPAGNQPVDNHVLRAHYTGALAKAETTMPDGIKLYRQYESDIAAGQLSPADRAVIDAAFKAFKLRHKTAASGEVVNGTPGTARNNPR